MSRPESVYRVAVAVPLRRLFDYLGAPGIEPGTRVEVPFGSRRLVGIVMSPGQAEPTRRLKSILRVLDRQPVLDGAVFSLMSWATGYYHHPPGEAAATALPVKLRRGDELAPPRGEVHFAAVAGAAANQTALARAPSQQQLYQALCDGQWRSWDELSRLTGCGRHVLRALEKRGMVARKTELPGISPLPEESISLNDEQQHAADEVAAALDGYRAFLLQGITGSGKTEVYLSVARQCIARGRQVLFLVPEISLTPQLVARVRKHLGDSVRCLHSGMSDQERYETWWLAREGRISAVLGTRSAVFTPLLNPGLIVVDEEHDQSYKQQDGLRYHARNLAIKRASIEGIPVVLGSATPSFESLRNAALSRHTLLTLRQRFGAARLPTIHIVDTGIHPEQNGLTAPLVDAVRKRLDGGEQSIIYVNRRGYAPVIHCYQCGWQGICDHCSARLVYHRHSNIFRCHHCGRTRPAAPHCPRCESTLFLGGAGTQRIEQALYGRFPDARICRLDRDEAGTAGKLHHQLERIRSGEVDIVVGTQLITKGHDFSRVSLVGVVNADQGLYSVDFRGPEFLFQQLLQVAGRAGRADTPGEVLIQTGHPEHPCISLLRRHDYDRFASQELDQRREAGFPPFGFLALLRAESEDAAIARQMLATAETRARHCASEMGIRDVEVFSPVPAPLEKLADRYRFQLMLRCRHRGPLHRLLAALVSALDHQRFSRSVRWSLDVDPLEML